MNETLIANLFEEFLGKPKKHNMESGQISFDCPSCSEANHMPDGDGKGNLEINYNKNVFKCWVCEQTNNTHGHIGKLFNLYGNYPLKKRYFLLRPEAIDNSVEKKFVTPKLPEGFKKLSESKPTDYMVTKIKDYLYQRGITDDIIEEFEIGYTLVGKFANRLIFPSYDKNYNLNFFTTRIFEKRSRQPKYLNPELEKEQIIFNEHKINYDATIYLVEGVTDHIVIPNSIALLGKKMTNKILNELQEKANSFVVIVLDGDAYENAVEIYKQLNFGRLSRRLRVTFIPKKYDPSKIFEKLGRSGICKLLRNSRPLSYNEL